MTQILNLLKTSKFEIAGNLATYYYSEYIKGNIVQIINFVDPVTKFEFDLSLNNGLGQANSALIKAYSIYDKRFHILGFYVKEWAKKNGIYGGSEGKLGGYAYLNMLIQFLQIVKPPVLPSLQEEFGLHKKCPSKIVTHPCPFERP